MRVLISTTANVGHFEPLLGLARACVEVGDDVRVAAPRSFTAAVTRAGFVHEPFDDPSPDAIGPVMDRLPQLSFDDANATVAREVFGRIDAQAALPGLTATFDAWRPDVVVRDPAELAALAVAVRAGVPHLQLAIGMTETVRWMAEMVTAPPAAPLVDLAGAVGLRDDSLIDALAGEPILSSVPEILDRAGDGAFAEDAVACRFRDQSPLPTPTSQWEQAGQQVLTSQRVAGDLDLPLVYVTFGSVTGSLPPFAGVFRQALDGLADLPVRVVMTVGRQVDPASVGPIPANARVAAWIPQAEVLAAAALVLGHGGFGTTMGALTAGVPQVVAPLFTTDQLINARHVAAAGAGRAVTVGPDGVAAACREVLEVLHDPAYRANAESVAAAAAALPPAADAIAVLERLAAG